MKAAVRKIAASCSESAARTSAQISSGESTSISTLLRTRGRSTSSIGLVRKAIAALRVAEDRAEDDEVLLDGSVRRRLASDPVVPPAFDRRGGDVLKRESAQGLVESPDGQSVVGQRRCLAGALLRGVSQPFSARIGERRAGRYGSVQLAAPSVREDLLQRLLSHAPRVVTGRRATATGPVRPESPVGLLAIRWPVLQIPNRPALALPELHVTARPHHGSILTLSPDAHPTWPRQ